MAAFDNSQTIRRASLPDWLRQGESRVRLQTIVRCAGSPCSAKA